MKMTTESYLILAAVAGGLYLAWSAKQTVKAAASAINPANNNNVINQAANAITGHDNETSSIGTWLFEKLNPAAVAAEQQDAMPTRTVKPVPVRVTR